jgi:hypothetical protein
MWEMSQVVYENPFQFCFSSRTGSTNGSEHSAFHLQKQTLEFLLHLPQVVTVLSLVGTLDKNVIGQEHRQQYIIRPRYMLDFDDQD